MIRKKSFLSNGWTDLKTLIVGQVFDDSEPLHGRNEVNKMVFILHQQYSISPLLLSSRISDSWDLSRSRW